MLEIPAKYLVTRYWLLRWTYESSVETSFFNTLRPRRNEQPFADDIFKRIFLNENVWISIKISLKFVPKGSINNIPALGQIMAWRRSGDKPLSEAMMVSLLKHICVTRPQWVNSSSPSVAYMRQWSESALVQVMACRLFSDKPLPEPVLVYYQLDSWEQLSAKFESEFYHFHSRKCFWNSRLPKWRPFWPERDESTHWPWWIWLWQDFLNNFNYWYLHVNTIALHWW